MITPQFKHHICKAWNEINLWKEYIKQFKWTQATYNTVDWATAGRLLQNKDYEPHQFVVRYINKWLPLQGEKYTVSNDTTCPCCGAEIEDLGHFM
eukprot:14669847-Ditylum_brightwellii.AAC.1